MDILNGKPGDIHSRARAVTADAGKEASHDFFSQPGASKTRKFTPPKFQFKVFHIAGPSMSECYEQDSAEYTKVMNAIVIGDCQKLEEDTYHSKDGDIRVLLRWLEVPEDARPDVYKRSDDDPPLEEYKSSEFPMGRPKPKHDKKKKKKNNPPVGMPDEPTVMM